MRKLRWPINKEQHAYMDMRAKQTTVFSRKNPHENVVSNLLKKSGLKFSRQSQWGYRIFDFWFHESGIALEIDGTEHRQDYDSYRDKANYENSGILVIRVKNGDLKSIKKVIKQIQSSEAWSIRRINLGLKPLKSQVKEGRVPVALLPLFAEANNAGRSYANSIPNK